MRILTLLLLAACGSSDVTATDSGTDGTTTATTTGSTGSTNGTEFVSCDGITPAVTDLSLDDLDGMLANKDFQLINVHVPVSGQIAGTDKDIAYTDVNAIASYLGDDLGVKVVLYCMTGPMSKIATDELAGLGYCNVFNLPDGLAQWQAGGYPME